MLYIHRASLPAVCPRANAEKRSTPVLHNSIYPLSEADRIGKDMALFDRYGDLRSGRLRTMFVCTPCTYNHLVHLLSSPT